MGRGDSLRPLAPPRIPTGRNVDDRDEIRAFLATRRAKITPEQAGHRAEAAAGCPACAASKSPSWPA